jgi:anti-sigma factor ChrR (cupin superfamily)
MYAIISGNVEPAKEIGAAPSSQTIVSDIQWTDLMPGIRAKHFWSDPATKRRGIYARWEPGAKLPLHKHIGDELLFMIEGSNFDESSEHRTGNLSYNADGRTHTVVSKNGHTAIAFLTGDIEVIK